MEMTKEEIAALVRDSLKEILPGVVQEELKSYTTTVLKPQLEDVLEESRGWLDDLIDEAESMTDDDDDPDDDDDGDGEGFDFDLDYVAPEGGEGNKVDDRALKQLQKRIDQLETEKEQERQQREETEAKAAKDSMMNAAIEGISGTKRVTNSKHFLTALQTDGKVIEKDGQMFIKGKDKYDMDALLPLNEGTINDLLATDYSHFDMARGGTGTGATNSTGSGYSSGGLKYFNSDGSPKVDPGQAMTSDRTGYLAEVAQLQKAGLAK